MPNIIIATFADGCFLLSIFFIVSFYSFVDIKSDKRMTAYVTRTTHNIVKRLNLRKQIRNNVEK